MTVMALAEYAAERIEAEYHGGVPSSLHFTESEEANELIASDPMALLVGFALDQQVTVQKAFSGPLELKRRLGSIDADTLASAEPEPVFRQKPAIHRYPGNMAKRVHELAMHIRDEYGGEADRCGRTPRTATSCARGSLRCPASAR